MSGAGFDAIYKVVTMWSNAKVFSRRNRCLAFPKMLSSCRNPFAHILTAISSTSSYLENIIAITASWKWQGMPILQNRWSWFALKEKRFGKLKKIATGRHSNDAPGSLGHPIWSAVPDRREW